MVPGAGVVIAHPRDLCRGAGGLPTVRRRRPQNRATGNVVKRMRLVVLRTGGLGVGLGVLSNCGSDRPHRRIGTLENPRFKPPRFANRHNSERATITTWHPAEPLGGRGQLESWRIASSEKGAGNGGA